MSIVRVLHVVKVLNRGGAETMIMNIYRNIDRKAVQFDFLCLSNLHGEYEDEIKKLGGNIYKLPDPEEQGRFKNFFNIYKVIKNNGYRIIHSHIMFYNGFINFIGWLAGVRTRISHSHSSSDLKKETYIRKMYMGFSRFLINTFSNVKVACGEKAGRYLYGKRRKYIVLKNGIDLNKYFSVTDKQVAELKNELNIDQNNIIIGHVGRFEKVKNHIFFINLAKNFKDKKLKYKIVLVGNGSEFDNIKNMIESEGLSQYFVLTGIRTNIEVFMKMFDIFLMPSLYEGFPLVVVEALAGDNVCFLSDNISKETNVIEGRVKFFNLNVNLDDLIIQIQCVKKESVDLNGELTKSGFSICDIVKKLTDIYMSKE